VNARRSQNRHVGGRADAALADDRDGIRNQRSEFERAIQTRDERAQIAVVDADDGRTAIEDARQLIGIMQFDEHIQTEGHRFAMEFREFAPRQNLRDEQHSIGPGRAGFEELVPLQDELLPQDGDAHRRAGRTQVIEVALKVLLVGEYAERGSAVGFVNPRNRHGIEVGADHPRRGRRLFHLGDDPEFPRCAECRGEPPPRRQ